MIAFHDYFWMLTEYNRHNEPNEDVLSFTKLISILNTPVHELKNILNEYGSVFSDVESIVDFIEWIEQNDG